MSNFEEIEKELVCYQGLLAIKGEYQNQSLSFPLMFSQIEHLKQKEQVIGKRILCWGTAVSIISYNVVNEFYDDLQPISDGSYDKDAGKLHKKLPTGIDSNMMKAS